MCVSSVFFSSILVISMTVQINLQCQSITYNEAQIIHLCETANHGLLEAS